MSKYAALVALMGLATAVHAQVTNVSQMREVFARTAFMPAQTITTTGLGSWSEAITVEDGSGVDSRGTATQDSMISSGQFTAIGTAFAQDDIQTYSGTARTRFEAVFDVAVDTPYTFIGSWSTSGGNIGLFPDCSMTFERLSPDPAVFHFSQSFEDFSTGSHVLSGSADLAGTLTPGSYRIATNVGIRAILNPGFVDGTARFNIDLRVPSPSVIPAIAIFGLATRRRRA